MALYKLSDKGPEGLKIINTILQQFLEQNRDELFQVTSYRYTSLTWALYSLSDKGDKALSILEKIIDKNIEKGLLKQETYAKLVLQEANEHLKGKGERVSALYDKIEGAIQSYEKYTSTEGRILKIVNDNKNMLLYVFTALMIIPAYLILHLESDS